MHTKTMAEMTYIVLDLQTPIKHLTFSAAFVACEAVQAQLHAMDEWAAVEGHTVNQAKSFLVDTFEDGPVQDDELGGWVSETLLWICCRDASDEQNAEVERLALSGGYMLGCAVEVEQDDQMHWGVVVAPTAVHPMLPLLEGAMGGQSMH